MWTIIRHEFKRSHGQILGWGGTLLGLGLMMVSMYDMMARQAENFEKLIAAYPKEMMAFFGGMQSTITPEGFLSIEFFSYMGILMGIFALLLGSALITDDEEKGTLDLVMAHPVSRAQLFWGRYVSAMLTTVSILLLGWLGIILPLAWSTMQLDIWKALLPFLSLFAICVVFLGLALLLSFILPARRLATMLTTLYVVIGFFIEGFSRIQTDLLFWARLSPLHYYQSGEAINAFNLTWFLSLTAVGIALCLISYLLFERRDIRVMGEGKWTFGKNHIST